MHLLPLRALRACLVVVLLCASFAWAQSEPSVSDIYAAAQAGKLEQAQVMVQQVLIAHPNSAKAHFIQSELYARQGKLSHAREALSTAERLAPGLPFAKPEAVQALRAQLRTEAIAPAPHAAPTSSSASWLLPLGLTAAVMALAYFLFARRNPVITAPQPAYPNGLSGPQTFGSNGTGLQQAGYGPAPYGQPAAGSGLGGRVLGGVATGLAVGAGVLAAEAIGRNLMGDHGSTPRPNDAFSSGDPLPLDVNPDMGGQNFGLSDTSWDDGGGSGVSDGSGGWDN